MRPRASAGLRLRSLTIPSPKSGPTRSTVSEAIAYANTPPRPKGTFLLCVDRSGPTVAVTGTRTNRLGELVYSSGATCRPSVPTRRRRGCPSCYVPSSVERPSRSRGGACPLPGSSESMTGSKGSMDATVCPDNLHMEQWRGRRFRSTDRLLPVLPLVIYTGTSPWSAAPRVIDLVTPGASPIGLRDAGSRIARRPVVRGRRLPDA